MREQEGLRLYTRSTQAPPAHTRRIRHSPSQHRHSCCTLASRSMTALGTDVVDAEPMSLAVTDSDLNTPSGPSFPPGQQSTPCRLLHHVGPMPRRFRRRVTASTI